MREVPSRHGGLWFFMNTSDSRGNVSPMDRKCFSWGVPRQCVIAPALICAWSYTECAAAHSEILSREMLLGRMLEWKSESCCDTIAASASALSVRGYPQPIPLHQIKEQNMMIKILFVCAATQCRFQKFPRATTTFGTKKRICTTDFQSLDLTDNK